MKIFLVGSQGTGKSSLVKSFDMQGIKKLDSLSAVYMKNPKDQISYGTSEWFEFQRRTTLLGLNAYVNNEDFISSRGYFDSIAYLQSSIKGLGSFSMREDIETMLKNVRVYEDFFFKNECFYFFIPIQFEISKEGNNLREIDKKYQQEINDILHSEFLKAEKKYHDSNFHYLSGSIKERLKQMYDIIECSI